MLRFTDEQCPAQSLTHALGSVSFGRRPLGIRLIVRPLDASASVEWPFEFEQDRVVIGRAAGVDVRLPDRAVSARHASLRVETSTRVVLVDHGSTNGTRVNGQALVAERPRALRDGDELALGPFSIEVRLNVPVAAPTSRERTVSLARRILERSLGDELSRPKLVVMNGTRKGTELVLPPPPARLRIGRAETNDLSLDDADASREHAEVIVDLDGALIRDLGSKNGLEIGGRKTTERRLKDRDEVIVGATVLLFEDPSEGVLKERESLADLPLAEPTLPLPKPAVAIGTAERPALEVSAAAADAEGPPPDPHREPPPRPPAPAPPAWPQRRFTAEMLVLVIAAGVLAASAIGLYYLLASG
jgi:pSer/pThr/pTyr-binding forkhead associated (FHA) protein